MEGAQRLLFISGQIPQTADGHVPADFVAQTELAWANMLAQLEAAGMSLANLVLDGDSIPGAIQQLLDHGRVNTSLTPSSEGAIEQAALQGGANLSHRSDPRFDTADFADGAPGNLRADYVLPSVNLQMADAQVFWPRSDDPLFPLVGVFTPGLPGGFPSSDHRLVWVDLRLPGNLTPGDGR